MLEKLTTSLFNSSLVEKHKQDKTDKPYEERRYLQNQPRINTRII